MAGLIAPYDAYDLVKALKKAVKVPIHLHSHFTSGMASMSHLKAIEAGADIVDTCMSPFAYRSSHPAVEPLVMTLLGTNRDTGFDIRLLAKINEVLEKEILPKYRHLLDTTKVSIIDINVLLHQTPGGMLSNLVNQLREMNALDKLGRVYEELPRVRKELGQIPLVTPTSQIVGIQTVNNVLFDDAQERYKMITDQVKDLCYGLYGKTAVPIDPKVQQKALKGYPRGEKPITCRPADVLEPELDKVAKDVGGLAKDMDDLLICALYPVTGRRFLKWKYGIEQPPESVRPRTLEEVRAEEELIKRAKAGELVEKKAARKGPPKGLPLRTFKVFVDDEYFEVRVAEEGGGGHPVIHSVQPVASSEGTPAAPALAAGGDVEGTALRAPMPGLITRLEVKVGDTVREGDTVLVLEAMKMENSIPAPVSGTIKAIRFGTGDSVSKDDVVCIIG
jgi:oxaloacetate decarboxylase alpha subunit/pyruvate carboxylase subunit B